MTVAEAKPSVEELTARALGASNLAVVEHVPGGAAMRVGALAMARARIESGADRPIPRPHGMGDELYTLLCAARRERDPLDEVEALLARALLGLRAAGQDSPARREAAAWLLRQALYIRASRGPAANQRAPEMWLRVARRVVAEYMSDRCLGRRGCDGTGMQCVTAGGRRLPPSKGGRGRYREARCTTCGGSGLAQTDAAARAEALGVSGEEYKAGGWGGAYTRALETVVRVAGRMSGNLRRASMPV